MQNKKLSIVILFVVFVFSVVVVAYAQIPTTIFPIKDLDNCESKTACKTYCDDTANSEKCLTWAEANNFMKKEEVTQARQFFKNGGPGGCTEKNTCRAFCSNEANKEQCIAWAQDHGLINKEEAERANKLFNIQGPGGCKGQECKTYCADQANHEACFKFAKDNNLIPVSEVQNIERMMVLKKRIETEGGPGGCKGEKACKLYCSDDTRIDECLKFAVDKGLVTKDRAQFMQGQFKKFQEFGDKIRNNPDKFIRDGFEEYDDFDEGDSWDNQDDFGDLEDADFEDFDKFDAKKINNMMDKFNRPQGKDMMRRDGDAQEFNQKRPEMMIREFQDRRFEQQKQQDGIYQDEEDYDSEDFYDGELDENDMPIIPRPDGMNPLDFPPRQ